MPNRPALLVRFQSLLRAVPLVLHCNKHETMHTTTEDASHSRHPPARHLQTAGGDEVMLYDVKCVGIQHQVPSFQGLYSRGNSAPT